MSQAEAVKVSCSCKSSRCYAGDYRQQHHLQDVASIASVLLSTSHTSAGAWGYPAAWALHAGAHHLYGRTDSVGLVRLGTGSLEEKEDCGMSVRAAADRTVPSDCRVCLVSLLYSVCIGCSWIRPQAFSQQRLYPKVMILLNKCHASMSFGLSKTRRPSVITFSPLPLSQLKSLLHLSDSLIIKNRGCES